MRRWGLPSAQPRDLPGSPRPLFLLASGIFALILTMGVARFAATFTVLITEQQPALSGQGGLGLGLLCLLAMERVAGRGKWSRERVMLSANRARCLHPNHGQRGNALSKVVILMTIRNLKSCPTPPSLKPRPI